MEIHFIAALLNYLADTIGNIANKTLQIEETPASTSAFAKFPKDLGPATNKSHPKRSGRGQASHISRAPSIASSDATPAPRWQERGDRIQVEDIYQTHYK